MRLVAALLQGCMAGFLVYMAAAMLVVDPTNGSSVSPAFVSITFFGGWAASTYFLYRGAPTVTRVVSRGALVGAAEWLVIGLAGIVMSGHLVAASAGAGKSDAATAGAAIGGGVVALLSGGVAVGMAVVCLIVFAVAYFAGREMTNTSGTPSKKCPECAEMVQAEARKCKHCGAALVVPSAV